MYSISNRKLIYATAAKVYDRRHMGSYDLVAGDFCREFSRRRHHLADLPLPRCRSFRPPPLGSFAMVFAREPNLVIARLIVIWKTDIGTLAIALLS